MLPVFCGSPWGSAPHHLCDPGRGKSISPERCQFFGTGKRDKAAKLKWVSQPLPGYDTRHFHAHLLARAGHSTMSNFKRERWWEVQSVPVPGRREGVTEMKQTVLSPLWGGMGGTGVRTPWVPLSRPADALSEFNLTKSRQILHHPPSQSRKVMLWASLIVRKIGG